VCRSIIFKTIINVLLSQSHFLPQDLEGIPSTVIVPQAEESDDWLIDCNHVGECLMLYL